jgi:hypothetical protein
MATWMALFLLVTFRFGLLASAIMIFCFHSLIGIPVTNQETWYGYLGWGGQLVLISLAIFGFYTSLAGQPILAEPIRHNSRRRDTAPRSAASRRFAGVRFSTADRDSAVHRVSLSAQETLAQIAATVRL